MAIVGKTATPMLIWRKQTDPLTFDVQEPTGALKLGITGAEVRSLAVHNRWAVEYPDTPAPTK